ncbi:hypothetical protein Tco_0256686 [Tanacetum coccineum]
MIDPSSERTFLSTSSPFRALLSAQQASQISEVSVGGEGVEESSYSGYQNLGMAVWGGVLGALVVGSWTLRDIQTDSMRRYCAECDGVGRDTKEDRAHTVLESMLVDGVTQICTELLMGFSDSRTRGGVSWGGVSCRQFGVRLGVMVKIGVEGGGGGGGVVRVVDVDVRSEWYIVMIIDMILVRIFVVRSVTYEEYVTLFGVGGWGVDGGAELGKGIVDIDWTGLRLSQFWVGDGVGGNPGALVVGGVVV